MNFEQFPSVFLSNEQKKMQSEIAQIRADGEQAVNAATKSYRDKEASLKLGDLKKSNEKSLAENIFWAITIPIVGPFMIHPIVGVIAIIAIIAVFIEAPGVGVFVLLAICGGCALYKNNIKQKINSGEQSAMNLREQYDRHCKDISKQTDSHIGNIVSKNKAKCDKYTNAFYGEVRSRASTYIDSKMVENVANWMVEGYMRLITSQQRDAHILSVDVPFQFKVYKDKITCNLGTFDFEIERAARINSCIEQAIVARAIATDIRIAIVEKTKDNHKLNDVASEVKLEYGDDHSAAIATFSYIAKNGNYKAVEKW